jgi:hypothetical protein
VLTVVDQYTRECLTLHANTTLSGEKVAAALDKIVVGRVGAEVDHRGQRHRIRQ